MKPRNPVAKYMRTFTKSATQKDRKAAAKRGHQKHKGDWRNAA